MGAAPYMLAHSASTRSDAAAHAASHAAAHVKSALGIGIGRSAHDLVRRGLESFRCLNRVSDDARGSEHIVDSNKRNLVQNLEILGQKYFLDFWRELMGCQVAGAHSWRPYGGLGARSALSAPALSSLFSGVPTSPANFVLR